MKLVDRLKEQAAGKLELANIKYPATVGQIFEQLETKEFYTELTYGTWADIQWFTGAEHPADIFTDNL